MSENQTPENLTQEKKIYVFWTGTNPLTPNRLLCLENLQRTTECNVVMVNTTNLHEYILPEHPLHEAYQYLSETHKSDYLRTYFMNFHGGGYSDIKYTTGSWIESFNNLTENDDKWIIGYKEINGGVAYPPNADKWEELIGNGCYICKPQTPLTIEWYNTMIALMDSKLELLKQHPSTDTRDCAERGNGYPIEWNEMLGRIFHKVCYNYKDHILNTLPILIFNWYL